MAEIISFVDPLTGVDDTTGWSADPSFAAVAHLNPSYSLLGGNATVTGYEGGTPKDLSHVLPRGLGVWDEGTPPVEIDEIDNFGAAMGGGMERIEITFNGSPYIVNSIEVRSLFNSDADHPNTNYIGQPTPPEQAAIDFYLNNTLIHTEYLVGEDFLGNDAATPDGLADGDASITYIDAYTVDRLVFRVPTSADFGTSVLIEEDPYVFTDYAVAKLDVTPTSVPIPAPGAVFLALFGAGLVGLKHRKAA